MYDYGKLLSASKRFLQDYKPDYYGSPAFIGSGKILDLLDYKLYRWPGHGVPQNSIYQYVEGEYMKAEEYPALIDDPTDFWMRSYLPRVFGAWEPLTNLTPFPFLWEVVGVSGWMIPFGIPPVQNALKALMEAGNEAMAWIQQIMGFEMEARGMGFPTAIGGAAKAPFDILADTMRGTRAIMVDMYRQPDMLLKAMERITPLYIKQGVGMATFAGNPVVFIPLHKGADGFMSDEQFKKFYWPTLKAVITGLIEGGCIPFPALEGHWDSRLKVIQDIPKGKTMWMVDQTDMAKVKETLGKNACLIGNVSSSMLRLATPDEVKAYCKKLIDTAGKGGGFIMGNGAFFDEAKSENVRAMVDFTKEYGVYK